MKGSRKRRWAEPGTVSEGTLRAEDLIPAYLDVARDLRLSKAERATVREVERAVAEVERENEGDNASADDYFTGEGASGDVNTLADILENHAPPYFYFGSLEGDGACFGFWLSRESLDEAVRDGEVWREGTDKPNRKMSEGAPDGWRYRLVVSDHGNMTLYTRNGREVWGLV